MTTKNFLVDWELRESIRRDALGRRDKLSDTERDEARKKIHVYLFNLKSFHDAQTVHVYLSMRNEVGTDEIIYQAMNMGKRVAVPRVYGEEMEAIDFASVRNFSQGSFGVREPEGGKKILVEEIDLVIVPLAAVDLEGNRLGYGKGFYDRFLSHIEAKKVGIAYETQIVSHVPAREEDVRLDIIVSEHGSREV